jgi:hypothetical protein
MAEKLAQIEPGKQLDDAYRAWGAGDQSAAPTRAGAAGLSNLGLTRDVKSTSDVGRARYRAAAQRVAEAIDVATDRLDAAVQAAGEEAWSAAGFRRHQKAVAALRAHQSRRERLLECTTGAVGVQVMRCVGGCGEQYAAALTCNVRICPRCVTKARRRNQAKVLSLLETVDELRRRRGKPPARWRFLTLTAKSQASFVPMRRAMGKWWGKLIRRKWWKTNVGSCIVFMETTHTEAGWHVHLHALVDAYVPRDWLVRVWKEITRGQGRPEGQHISAPQAGKKGIARELAKYAAKDLGSAQLDEDDPRAIWGVAGTPERLAEFYLGALRWRTLRTYGLAYDAMRHLDESRIYRACTCEKCGGDMVYARTEWMRAENVACIARRRGPPVARATDGSTERTEATVRSVRSVAKSVANC